MRENVWLKDMVYSCSLCIACKMAENQIKSSPVLPHLTQSVSRFIILSLQILMEL